MVVVLVVAAAVAVAVPILLLHHCLCLVNMTDTLITYFSYVTELTCVGGGGPPVRSLEPGSKYIGVRGGDASFLEAPILHHLFRE